MEQSEIELGVIRGQLAFHKARLHFVLSQRAGKDMRSSLDALLQRERVRFAAGSIERAAFDQSACSLGAD